MIKLLNKGILHRFKTAHNSEVVIADITAVTSMFSEKQINEYYNGHSRERTLQLVCADFIISELLNETTKISRNKKGAPFLKNKATHLSISHTSNYMDMIINNHSRPAIDIEVKGRDISRVKKRFTTDSEVEHFESFLKTDALLGVWGAKECLFKIMQASGVLFTENMKINYSMTRENELIVNCSVNHPSIKSDFNVISCIFEPLILSYIDATSNAK